jgi:Sjoegren syndrome nuclear autoantigen 1
LVACIEDLREKREELNRSILRDEEEKSKIQKELSTLTERLSRLNEDLARKMQARAHRPCHASALFLFSHALLHTASF